MIMKVKKLISTGILGLMLACTFMQTSMLVKANNHTDKVFNFSFIADGSDTAPEAPRAKNDNTASYVKSNAGVDQFSVWFGGTNGNDADAMTSNIVSSYAIMPAGSYRYISNNAYGRFRNVYPIFTVGQDNRPHHLSGKWSPDNISGRY